MNLDENCIIIDEFMGDIYHTEITDHKLFKALYNILKVMHSKNINISYTNFVHKLSKKMMAAHNNSENHTPYKAMEDTIIAILNQPINKEKNIDILGLKLLNFEIPKIDFLPVDIFIETDEDEYTHEKFINKFILNNKYACIADFTQTDPMIRSEVCVNYKITLRGFDYVVEKIEETLKQLK